MIGIIGISSEYIALLLPYPSYPSHPSHSPLPFSSTGVFGPRISDHGRNTCRERWVLRWEKDCHGGVFFAVIRGMACKTRLNPRELSPFYLGGEEEGNGVGGLMGDVRRRKVFPNSSGKWDMQASHYN